MNIKKTFSRCLLAAVSLMMFAACNKNQCHIEGNITDAKDSVLYLQHMSLDGPVNIDSVKLSEDGAFSFAAEGSDAPEFYRLRIGGSWIDLSIDSTETVTFKASLPKMSWDYEVSGSDDCEKIKEINLSRMQFIQQLRSIWSAEGMTMRQTEDSIAAVRDRYKEYIRNNYIFKEPHRAYAYFALFLAVGNEMIFDSRASEEDIRTYAAVATAWDTYYPEALRGKNLHNIAIEGLKVLRRNYMREHGPGIDPAVITEESIIDVPLVDNKGRQRSLKELKGKVVILDFHAFSASNSTERIMMLRDVYNKYHERGLEIYQVSVDPDEHFWKTKTEALPWISLRDPDNIESRYLLRYNVQSIPTFFLIDRNNAIYKRDAQIKNLDEEINSLL